jgi:hypothetical protein
MMICCYLMHSKVADSANDAMTKYAHARTKNNEVFFYCSFLTMKKGVTIPSQRRYIRYYEDVLKYGEPKQPKITLKSIRVKADYVSAKKTELFVEIFVRKEPESSEEFVSRSSPVHGTVGDYVEISLENLSLKGDVKIVFYDVHVVKV